MIEQGKSRWRLRVLCYAKIMYRDDVEALRARVRTLEAQIQAEQRRREAAEAESRAAQAAVYEERLAVRRAHPLPRTGSYGPLVAVFCAATLLCVYLGIRWAGQCHRAQALKLRMVHAAARCPHYAVWSSAGRTTPDAQTLSSDGERSAGASDESAKGTRITPSAVAFVESVHHGELYQCYERARDAGPVEPFEAAVSLTIDRNGDVESVSVDASPSGSQRLPKLRRCIADSVRTWKFVGGPFAHRQSVSIPLSF